MHRQIKWVDSYVTHMYSWGKTHLPGVRTHLCRSYPLGKCQLSSRDYFVVKRQLRVIRFLNFELRVTLTSYE